MPEFLYRAHAVQRMFARKISARQIRQVVETGATVEDYADEMPAAGRLILGWAGPRPLHVVAGESADAIVIITAYSPAPDLWTKDFMRRRSK